MKNKIVIFILLLGLTIFNFSCQKEEVLGQQLDQYKVPSIEMAKTYFNEGINFSLPRVNILFRNGDGSLNPDWDESETKKFKNEPQENIDILYTPIYLPTSGQAKSFVGSVEVNGGVQSKIFMLLYTQSYNKEAFSGFILIYNLEGQIEYSYKYINGQRIAEGLPFLVSNYLNRTNSDNDCESPLDSIGCLIDWIGGDWFGIDGFIENDVVEIIAAGDSSSGGFSDSDFGSPGFSIPILDDSIGGVNGSIEEPWWLDNTVSANALSIIMALELENISLPEAEWLLNIATIEQLTAIANYLNTNRVKDKNTIPNDITNSGVNQNQVTEISQEAVNAIMELINTILIGGSDTMINDLFEYLLNESLYQVVVLEPDNPIEDISEYLNCFDTSQPATFTIYVNQPTANNDEAWSIAGGVGHAFIGITQGNISRSYGLYPIGSSSPFSPEDPHIFGNNGGDDYDVSVTIDITAFQLSIIIEESVSYDANYDLNTNNCSNFVIDISQLTDMPIIPDTHGEWPGGSGNNPGALGEDLREMELQTGMSRDLNGGFAPENNGDCN